MTHTKQERFWIFKGHVSLYSHRLGQVPWAIHVKAPEHSQVEREQLQGDDTQDALQTVHTVRHFDGAARALGGLVVILVTDHDGSARTRHHLLQCILTLGVGVVSHDDHDDGHEFVD